jgi:hypothetical protein
MTLLLLVAGFCFSTVPVLKTKVLAAICAANFTEALPLIMGSLPYS